ncbi:hypothetical protein ACIBMX_10750 [Streptomyces phaeochromogenes]|uniref:hypothetical protein n=1 Tax=Streptomyces phaeochromogenes TaxID=1923 RepID=UPI0033D273BC
MVISAPVWLGNENVWVVAMGVLAFIGTVIGARAAWRSAHPRLRLYIAKTKNQPVLAEGYTWDGFAITHQGRDLVGRPHLTTIEVSNLGSRDVPIPGNALQLEVGSTVLSVLGVSTVPPSVRAVPEVTFEDKTVRLEDGHVPSGYRMLITVLCARDPYSRLQIRSALPDVQIINKFPPTQRSWVRTISFLGHIFLLLAGIWQASGWMGLR